jgi:hypothetical protein
MDLSSNSQDQSMADSSPISHGICPQCYLKFQYNEISLQTLVESFPFPILIIDDQGVVQSGNSAALTVIGKSPEQLANRYGGNVIECIYASLPEGCGNTVHCSGCIIRQSVMKTFTIGTPSIEKVAFNYVYTPNGIQLTKFVISTEKVGDRVLLQIHSMIPSKEETMILESCCI